MYKLLTALLLTLSAAVSAAPKTQYKGEPWVTRLTDAAPRQSARGSSLHGRHIALWASHGRYYSNSRDRWQWQRPQLYATCEDLFTQTIVTPYLIPMLENAGATVYTPRERDWQTEETIVDNDRPQPATSYIEVSVSRPWQDAPAKGFATPHGAIPDGYNPFDHGTVRMAQTTRRKKRASTAYYQPALPKAGKYAVYVSYATVKGSVSDAKYRVWHKGRHTDFAVNQRMGGGTWVCLGTFDFDKGSSPYNRVEVSNISADKGFVTTDAVRFGGGMGVVSRGGKTSGLPKALEGARYWTQWAGMPYSVYSTKKGADDYSDDINARSEAVNTLAGGSPYAPKKAGRGVPIELSLAIHSDAGADPQGQRLIGSLGISTTDFNGGLLGDGSSRQASKDFAKELADNLLKDLRHAAGQWTVRGTLDRNYSETRRPLMTSAIIETLSHQNFADMSLGHDPNFKFALARSLYKTILRHTARAHGSRATVAPLAPQAPEVTLTDLRRGEATLSWLPTEDTAEPTAQPTGYIVYTREGEAGYDNGTYVRQPRFKLRLDRGTLYTFKIAAVNDGGQSFTTEELTAQYTGKDLPTIALISGFHRLSGPAPVHTDAEQGFDLDTDPGVALGGTNGFCGRQLCFDPEGQKLKYAPQSVDYDHADIAPGASDSNLTGLYIAGNTLDHTRTHATAIAATGDYNIQSASSQAIEAGRATLDGAAVADCILGLEKDDGHSLLPYKTFTPAMQRRLSLWQSRGGRLIASGAYIASDAQTKADTDFLAAALHIRPCSPTNAHATPHKGPISFSRITFSYYDSLNPDHYAATSTDALTATPEAYPIMLYADGTPAAVACPGDRQGRYRTVALGFPFECIRSEAVRQTVMRSLLIYLAK